MEKTKNGNAAYRAAGGTSGKKKESDYARWALEQKIKIFVTPRLKALLQKDAENFEFFHSDEKPKVNMNAFLTELIVHYYEAFNIKRNAFIDSLQQEIVESGLNLNEEEANAIARSVAGGFFQKQNKIPGERTSEFVSIKPTRDSKTSFSLILNDELINCSLSEYFREMFESYASMPQDEREKIIFADRLKVVKQAIADRRKLKIVNKHGRSDIVSPYSIVSSKEELHCYLLATRDGRCMTFRLSRISEAKETGELTSFDDKQIAMFERMTKYAPQYIYDQDEEEVVVRLSERGVALFKALFVHRPVPTSIDGNVYRFNCSYMQIKQYFRSFGKEAYVCQPNKLSKAMRVFYWEASKFYNDMKKEKAGSKRGTAETETSVRNKHGYEKL